MKKENRAFKRTPMNFTDDVTEEIVIEDDFNEKEYNDRRHKARMKGKAREKNRDEFKYSRYN